MAQLPDELQQAYAEGRLLAAVLEGALVWIIDRTTERVLGPFLAEAFWDAVYNGWTVTQQEERVWA